MPKENMLTLLMDLQLRDNNTIVIEVEKKYKYTIPQ